MLHAAEVHRNASLLTSSHPLQSAYATPPFLLQSKVLCRSGLVSASVCEDSERLRNTPSKDRAGKPPAKGQSLFEKKWLGGFRKLHHRRPQTVAQIIKEILETSPEHGHGIPANMGDKLGDKTVDKRKTKPGRRTRHPSQGGRQERKQEKANTREANTASQPRQTHLRQH